MNDRETLRRVCAWLQRTGPLHLLSLIRKTKWLGLFSLMVITLVGCGGGEQADDTSSSSSSSSSSSASSSSGLTFIGNPTTGQSEWNSKSCGGCHGVFDSQTGKSTGVVPVDAVAIFTSRTQASVATVIRDTMPPADPDLCGQSCADDITSYIFQIGARALNDGSGSSSSGAALDGAKLYLEKGCLACHGADGLQKSQPIVFKNYSLETLIEKIDRDMPTLNPGSCVGDCAKAVGEYLWSLRPVVSCDSGEKVLPRRLRLLTKFEYVNTINDLFGRTDGATRAAALGTDTEVRGFDNNAAANAVTIARMDGYWTAAESVANAADLNKWLSSCGQQNTADCFVANFGHAAFRRPLTAEEKTDYIALFNSGASAEDGARHVVQTMLVSPNFLYRTELGQNGRLTQYEVASLLSYTFWGTMPDTALFNLAASNSLSSAAQIRQAVERLVSHEKAQKQFAHFGRQWLQLEPLAGVDRDPNLFPAFNAQIAQAMDAELELFLQEMLLKDGYTMADFFESDFTFANQALANFYGINGVSGSQMTKVGVNEQRGGILFMGALLTRNSKFDESHPIKRGLIVRRNLLCQEFGVPPANIGEVEPFDPSKPTRERFAAHSSNEACAACHQFIDEIGFAFENYDAVGHYRTAEANGAAVDASGTISGLKRMTDDDEHVFFDLKGLSAILANEGLEPASACVAEQFQRMMDGLDEPDACTLANTVARWNPAVNSIKDLWVEIVASQTFTQRQ